jgi:hypothetical protein
MDLQSPLSLLSMTSARAKADPDIYLEMLNMFEQEEAQIILDKTEEQQLRNCVCFSYS